MEWRRSSQKCWPTTDSLAKLQLLVADRSGEAENRVEVVVRLKSERSSISNQVDCVGGGGHRKKAPPSYHYYFLLFQLEN